MQDRDSRPWIGAMIIAAVLYLVAAQGSAALAAAASSPSLRQLMRLCGFAACGVVFVAHFAYERYRLRAAAQPLAWHTTYAAALGGFLIAGAAIVHNLAGPAGFRPRMLTALIAWPLVTAVPIFIAARILATLLGPPRD